LNSRSFMRLCSLDHQQGNGRGQKGRRGGGERRISK